MHHKNYLSMLGVVIFMASEPSVVLAWQEDGVMPELDRSTSLFGSDLNENGVRDDIEEYIDSLPDTAEQKMALMQGSAALSASLVVNLADQTAVDTVDRMIMDASSCRYSMFGIDAARKYSKDSEKYTIAFFF